MLPNTGQLGHGDIRDELRDTGQIGINDTNPRRLCEKTTPNTQIRNSDFYGKYHVPVWSSGDIYPPPYTDDDQGQVLIGFGYGFLDYPYTLKSPRKWAADGGLDQYEQSALNGWYKAYGHPDSCHYQNPESGDYESRIHVTVARHIRTYGQTLKVNRIYHSLYGGGCCGQSFWLSVGGSHGVLKNQPIVDELQLDWSDYSIGSGSDTTGAQPICWNISGTDTSYYTGTETQTNDFYVISRLSCSSTSQFVRINQLRAYEVSIYLDVV